MILNEQFLANLLLINTDPLGTYVTVDQFAGLDEKIIKFYLGPLYSLEIQDAVSGHMLKAVLVD